jgi:hypothetical protein
VDAVTYKYLTFGKNKKLYIICTVDLCDSIRGFGAKMLSIKFVTM